MAQQDRFGSIELQLMELASTYTGLNETVDFAVSGATIQEFLSGLAETNKLNINVDPRLDIKIYNNFTHEKVLNILMFLVREYDLDIRFTGSIMSFYKFNTPFVRPLIIAKEIKVHYDTYSNMLTLDLNNDSIKSVVKKLTQITPYNIILAPGIADRQLSIFLESLPFPIAMEKMCFAHDLALIKNSEDIFTINKASNEADGNEVSSGVLKKNGKSNLIKNKLGELSGSINVEVKDTLGQKLISLEADNVPFTDIIQVISEQAGLSYFLYSKIDGNATVRVYNVSFSELLWYLFRGTSYTFKVDRQIYLIGDRQLEGLRANKLFQFQYRSLSSILEMTPAELKKGVEIKEFKELNSVLLTGSELQIIELEDFFKQLDKIVPLIYMEVILVDVRKVKSISTGIKVGVSDSVKTGGTLFPGLDFTYSSKSINDFLNKIGANKAFNIGAVPSNFYASLRALEQNSNVKIRSTHKLSTLNGHEAKLNMGSTRYYSQKTQNVIGSLNPNTIVTQTYHAVNADLTITILPVVSGDSQVTLNIEVKISDFIGVPPDNAPPPTSASEFKSILRVRNEEMVVLGGIERNEQNELGDGVPLLSRIPILKWLFSSRTRSTSKVTSVVFIKPTMIY